MNKRASKQVIEIVETVTFSDFAIQETDKNWWIISSMKLDGNWVTDIYHAAYARRPSSVFAMFEHIQDLQAKHGE